MYQIRIATLSEFESSCDNWNRLVRSMDRPSIFCTWDWIHTWWEHFRSDYSLRILFVCDGDALVGILPLTLRKMLLEDSLFPVRVLSFCGTYEVFPDHTDFIYCGLRAKPYLDAILDYLSINFRDWDVLHFSHVAEDSHLLKFFSSNASRFKFDLRHVSIAPYISLKSRYDNDFEKYLQSLSRNKRHDLRRRRNALYAKLGVNYVSSGAYQIGTGIRQLFLLHEMRASRKKLKSSFKGERLIQFHEKISEIFDRYGYLFLRFLKNCDSSVAALYCFQFQGRLFAYQSGLDPDWESKGVGSVLMVEAIREATKRNLAEFDFLRGGEIYKNSWTSEARTLHEIWVYNNTVRSSIFRLAYKARGAAKSVIQRMY